MQTIQFQPRDLVEAGIFESEDEAIRSALAEWLHHHPDLRIRLAVHQYDHGDISIGAAAERAGVSQWEMMEILAERGVELRLGPATIEEAREEAATLERYLRAHPR